jgi:predicted nuclease of predicted toxin-antitoxin system
MRLLADENVEPIVVEWLRVTRHDVLHMLEADPGAPDTVVLERARDEQRVLITYDRDFGELVFRTGAVTAGVLLLRLSPAAPAERLVLLQARWTLFADRLEGSFVVVADHKVRVRQLRRP